ncbi:NAD-dependent epimerase/dehydratase family protein [Actinomycetospora termitidis]|uniref:NAD(P)-dependent oxidoreductase n=1 Tax=Actinomycetospora termitidis TaxID=3053470 RepID=A0ABT7MGP1_9PSEU|nr:NAD(P)-dependent oxidoreductase [Actinomycetospora sp. Odt1-22]MDL5159843.1 NAD(P)-dependent oxidoreductase [Actinomycetospora sp. Odt1-22]
MTHTLLVTGAAGRIGGMLRPRLARPDRILRLLDVATVEDPGEREEVVTASVTDLDALTAACRGADAVVHLGGISSEAPWHEILDVNIHGTFTVFEAARRAGVPRVVFASSNHAVGFHPAVDPVPDDLPPRPDTFYGVAKVAGEALGSLYHDRYGLDVVCLRIGTCIEEPPDARALATWLSPDDVARLVEAAVTVRSPGFRVVWGVSDNTRRRWSLTAAAELGYRSADDAEVFAGRDLPTDPWTDAFVGGSFAGSRYDEPGV